ncbi:MAG: hypothetical protein ACP5K2_06380 [bacterium]
MPTMKLSERERIGGKIKRRYNMDTPFNRVIEIGTISEDSKCKLLELRKSIDLIELSLKIEKLAEKLDYVYQKKIGRYNHE